MNMKFKRFGAATLAGVMALSMMSGMAFADSDKSNTRGENDNGNGEHTDVANATIDQGKTGSLHIFKYDMTAAKNDGIETTTVNTDETGRNIITITKDGTQVGDDIVNEGGYQISEIENAYKDYAIKGVEFTYLRIADIDTYSVTQEDGSSEIKVVYGIKESDKLIDILGIEGTEIANEDGKDGLVYYLSDTLIDSLAEAERSDLVTTKNALEKYISDNGGTKMDETSEEGFTEKSGLDLGLYLVVETKVPEQVTATVAPFFVSVPMTQQDGDAWNYDVWVYPKNESGGTTFEKEVMEVTSGVHADTQAAANTFETHGITTDSKSLANSTGDITIKNNQVTSNTGVDGAAITGPAANDDCYDSAATASTGDVLYYQITNRIPTITSEASYLSTYTVVDTLSKGIEYGAKNEKGEADKQLRVIFYSDKDCTNPVYEMTEAAKEFIVAYGDPDDAGNTSMTINITAEGLKKINGGDNTNHVKNLGDCYMRISYAATVNNDADVIYGNEGNPNTATLTYKRTNDTYYDTITDECIVYTYAMKIVKTFSDKKGDPTKVEFKAQNTTDGYYLVAKKDANVDGLYYVDGEASKFASEKDATTFTPNANGELWIYGIEDDNYTLTEIKTDNGYTLLKDDIKVAITATATEYNFAQNGTSAVTPGTFNKGTNSVEDTYDDDWNNETYAGHSDFTDTDAVAKDADKAQSGAVYNGHLQYTVNKTVTAAATVNGDKVSMLACSLTDADEDGDKKDDSTSKDAIVPMTIVNSKGFNLPKTGGDGTLMMVIGGGAALAIAVVAIAAYKKKSEGEAA